MVTFVMCLISALLWGFFYCGIFCFLAFSRRLWSRPFAYTAIEQAHQHMRAIQHKEQEQRQQKQSHQARHHFVTLIVGVVLRHRRVCPPHLILVERCKGALPHHLSVLHQHHGRIATGYGFKFAVVHTVGVVCRHRNVVPPLYIVGARRSDRKHLIALLSGVGIYLIEVERVADVHPSQVGKQEHHHFASVGKHIFRHLHPIVVDSQWLGG